ncbi:CHLP [Symbiodinium sp. CCMP2592]|nr:CHLP [Symbiodinium sp. CCMP2592]
MSLKSVLGLGLVAHASAFARVSMTTMGEALGQQTLKDYVDGLKAGNPRLGDLQFMGSCCGDYTGAAQQVQNSINTNELYGKTEEIAGSIFKDSGCTPVVGDSMKSNATAGCNYFSVFGNKAHADHEYAANCVPATTCKENVVGMTQGMIALYGVVMQILQQNLGSLAWIGEGDMKSCLAGMNKANMGSLDGVIVHKPIKIGPITVGSERVLEFEGMKKLGAADTLSKCKDDSSVGYLFIHKNLYWQNDKSAIDLEAFQKFKADQKVKKDEAKRQKEACLGYCTSWRAGAYGMQRAAAAKAAEEKDEEAAKEALDEAGAEAPTIISKEADKDAIAQAQEAGKIQGEVQLTTDGKAKASGNGQAVTRRLSDVYV